MSIVGALKKGATLAGLTVGKLSALLKSTVDIVNPKPTQKDLALKALRLLASATAGRPRRQPRGMFYGDGIKIGEVKRRKKLGGWEMAPIKYLPLGDFSRYPGEVLRTMALGMPRPWGGVYR